MAPADLPNSENERLKQEVTNLFDQVVSAYKTVWSYKHNLFIP